jgi:glycosyltransferase involved in cell wall biosynthesis
MSLTFWFSPVPPARTDIAQYSARVVPHLASLIDLKVVRPDAVQADSPQEDQQLGSHKAGGVTIHDLNASRLSLYNIGNNPAFHGQILRTGMQHPGIVILHDRALQDLCHAVLDDTCEGEESANSYQAAMSHWYGRAGREAARAALVGDVAVSALAHDFPLFEVALQGALGVVTHNPEVAVEIAERFPGMPVVTLHLPYGPTMGRAESAPVLRQDRPIRLIMFGYLNPNRRLCDFLRAWAQSPQRDRFELDLAGEMNNEPEVRAVIAEMGLGAQVRCHGFLPYDQLDALISHAHLALNLRNPTMGEASGSQLRIWANGVASVVSDTGWYRQIPEGSALRVSTQNEHRDLLALLDDLAECRIDLAAIARRGDECLAAGDPATYAASLAEWLVREREPMFTRWAETALIEATARTYALCTPRRFVPRLPARLLA